MSADPQAFCDGIHAFMIIAFGVDDDLRWDGDLILVQWTREEGITARQAIDDVSRFLPSIGFSSTSRDGGGY